MTRKDFEVIAIAFRRSRPASRAASSHGQWLDTRAQMMSVLALTNPRFDRLRFIEATEA